MARLPTGRVLEIGLSRQFWSPLKTGTENRAVLGLIPLEDVGASLAAMGATIELRGLVKTYRGGAHGPVHAVRGIDVSIARGQTVALLGPNGAGKSTTIDMMLGLTRPDAGTVSVFGRTPEAAVRAGWVGGMLQTGSLLEHLKVRELVSLMASYYPHPLDVADVLRLTGADEFADQLTTKLSGG